MDFDQPEASSSTRGRSNVLYVPETTYDAQPQPAFQYRSIAHADPVICIDNGDLDLLLELEAV